MCHLLQSLNSWKKTVIVLFPVGGGISHTTEFKKNPITSTINQKVSFRNREVLLLWKFKLESFFTYIKVDKR